MRDTDSWRGSNNLGGSGGGTAVKVAGMNFDVAAEADLAALAIMKVRSVNSTRHVIHHMLSIVISTNGEEGKRVSPWSVQRLFTHST